MAKFKVNMEDYISKVTDADGNIDYSKGNEMLESDVLKHQSKNVPNMEALKAEAYDLAKVDFIKEQNIEGVDSVDTFKQHLSKLGGEDKAQEVLRLSTANTELQTKYNDLEVNYNTMTKESSNIRNAKLVSDKKPNIEVEYLTYKIDKLDGDTFQDKFDAFIADETNNKYFEPVAPINQGDSGVGTTKAVGDKMKMGFERILEESGKLPTT